MDSLVHQPAISRKGLSCGVKILHASGEAKPPPSNCQQWSNFLRHARRDLQPKVVITCMDLYLDLGGISSSVLSVFFTDKFYNNNK